MIPITHLANHPTYDVRLITVVEAGLHINVNSLTHRLGTDGTGLAGTAVDNHRVTTETVVRSVVDFALDFERRHGA